MNLCAAPIRRRCRYSGRVRVRLVDAEAPAVVVGDDPAGGRRGEVGAEHQHLVVAIAAEEFGPGIAGPRHIVVEPAGDVGQADLDGVVPHVARDHRAPPGRGDHHADMPRRVSRRRLEAHLVGDLVVHIDQLVQECLQIRRCRKCLLISLALEVRLSTCLTWSLNT